ncbi:MAG: type II toxin-antitoxin system YafQ family toxin [bacterium]|nr:type II toxin-antitoxin system YafQ family toxin [bacterium]
MCSLKYSSRFKKDLKRFRHNRQALFELEKILDRLIRGDKLPERNCSHRLQGEFKGCYECHIRPDMLLIYKIEKSELILLLLRVGSHAELF